MSNRITIGTVGLENGITKARFDSELALCDPAIPLRLDFHSNGGCVFEGFGIGESIKAWPGKKIAMVNVKAFSIASYLTSLCDEVEIKPTGYVMIHNPYVESEGDDEDHAAAAATLKSMKEELILSYMGKTGMGEAEVKALMKAETYLNARQAVELGFADRVIGSEPVAEKSLVFAAFFKEEAKEMIKPAPATLKEIKKAFPKAASDFVVRCMEEELPLEGVTSALLAELQQENETLKAQIKAMQEEMVQAKAISAKAEDMPATEDEDEIEDAPTAKAFKKSARKPGHKPLPQGFGKSGSFTNAQEEWNESVNKYVALGMTKQKATVRTNRENPGLRERLVQEANA